MLAEDACALARTSKVTSLQNQVPDAIIQGNNFPLDRSWDVTLLAVREDIFSQSSYGNTLFLRSGHFPDKNILPAGKVGTTQILLMQYSFPSSSMVPRLPPT